MPRTLESTEQEDFLPPDMRLLEAAPPNSWVAVSADRKRIVASGESLSSVLQKAEALGESDVTVAKIPPFWGAHAF
jgi:hypothetical protein